MAPLPNPKPSRSSSEWRKTDQPSPDETQPLNVAEIAALLEQTRSAAQSAEAAAAKAAKAQAAPSPAKARPASGPAPRSASSSWSLAAVLIVFILAAASVAVVYLIFAMPYVLTG